MPRIKRWFPVNHNINRDPEVWAMRREIGEKSLSIWLEFLSIADQNEGELPGDYDQLIRSVSGTCQSTVRTVSDVYQYAISQLWLASEPTLHVAKYAKYHKTREPQKPLLGSLPSEPSEPSELKNQKPSPSADSKNAESKKELDPRIKEVLDPLFNAHREKFIKSRVMAWVGEAQKYLFSTELIVATLKEFLPRAGYIDNWYPYLDRILYRLNQDQSRDMHEADHERNKRVNAEIAKEMFPDAKANQEDRAERRFVSRR